MIHTFPGHQKGRRVKFLHSIRPFAIAGILASILTSGTTFGQTSGIAPQSPLGVTDLSSVHLNRPTLDQLYLADKERFFPSLLGLGQFGSKAISTRHFDIYYFGASNTAARIAKIADEKLETIGRFYPGFMDNYHRLTVVVLDDSDVLGNAFASTTNNLIVFWSSPYDITERGSSKWVENVFVHELTHSITHRAANKEWPFRFGFLGTNRSNQNPDFVFNIPLYNKVLPSWYSEGVAQFEATENGDDTWDTHRDMKLRMAVLEDDMLTLDGMSFFGYHGVHAEERTLGQRFVVDLQVYLDMRAPGRSDVLHDTISYSELYHTAKAVVEGEPHNLLESVAETIAQQILNSFSAEAVRVCVGKSSPPITGAILKRAAVEIYRERQQ